jgi:protein-L-isoaspartate(D-aspartate) O-methyltransferase
LDHLGYRNVTIRVADGTLGWPEEAPFDAVLVTAGSPALPPPLVEQLGMGGRLVIPTGSEDLQMLRRMRRTNSMLEEEELGECRFVKLMGKFGWPN